MSGEPATHVAVETVARNSRARLIAYLASRSRDLAGAEDALSEAFAAALERWPSEGIPRKPEAWLLLVARNRLIDAARRRQVRQEQEKELLQLANEAQTVAAEHDDFPDERLKLLFVCAHPAIDAAARTPLMLQAVLGLDAARIAAAFVVSPASMGQRLVRAKAKIREAGIPFRAPGPAEWQERVSFVLDAVYSAYTLEGQSVHVPTPLAAEAVTLARMLVQLMPEEAEAHGLLALLLHCEARRAARHTAGGEFTPLHLQDVSMWSRPLMAEAEELLRAAVAMGRTGRYQLEAAIQSIHAHRAVTGDIDWREILLLYEGLVRLAPGLGSLTGRAVAMAQAVDAALGLAALDALPAPRVAAYQPYWAARAHILQMLGRGVEAREDYARAIALTEDSALRAWLEGRAAEL